MSFYYESLTINKNTFKLLRDLIQERIGLFFEEGKAEILADKLSPLVIERGFANFLDYYYLLRYDEEARGEWDKVIDALTIQETFFWREPDQIKSLVEAILPRWFRRFPDATLRIWSAACATGEEPLSIAMALSERGCFESWPLEIVATDISPAALARAREGLYRERAFRNLPPGLKERYFSKEGDLWRVSPDLHRRIRWGQVNLLDEAAAEYGSSPVIFCRNVFIYFTAETIRKVVDMFYRSMPNPAYLFVAAAESLLRIPTGFHLAEIGGAFVYVKGSDA